jgi:hypothetical protein
VHVFEEEIQEQEQKGYAFAANWNRINLAQVYLEIIAGSEKPHILVVLRNLRFVLNVMFLGSSRIHGLIANVLNSSLYEPNGFYVGKSLMILGLLSKTKKARPRAPAPDRSEADTLAIWTDSNPRAGRNGARGIGTIVPE